MILLSFFVLDDPFDIKLFNLIFFEIWLQSHIISVVNVFLEEKIKAQKHCRKCYSFKKCGIIFKNQMVRYDRRSHAQAKSIKKIKILSFFI